MLPVLLSLFHLFISIINTTEKPTASVSFFYFFAIFTVPSEKLMYNFAISKYFPLEN